MLTPEQIELLKTTIAKGLSDLELQLFLNVCDRTGLDPFARQICPVLRWDSKANKNVMSIQVLVDGYRQIAQNTGEYAGCDRVLFDEGLTLYEHLETGRKKPKTASITVYRLVKGVRCPFSADVSWDDFYPGDKLGFMWNSKPHQMISKTCESQALRKAFQSELKLLATEEEIAVEALEPTPVQVKKSDEWFEMQANLKTAKTIEEVEAISKTVQTRLPMAGSRYQLEKELQIAKERLEIPVPVTVPANTPEQKMAIISPAQRQRFYTIATKAGLTNEGAKKLLSAYGFTSSKEITTAVYDELCRKASDPDIVAVFDTPTSEEGGSVNQACIFNERRSEVSAHSLGGFLPSRVHRE